MAVTLIEQQAKAPGRMNFVIKLLTWLNKGKWEMTANPYPHDALELKPSNFETKYAVDVTRMDLEDLPTDWTDREHWQPLLIKRNKGEKSKRVLYHWHGSAFISKITPFHWNFLGRLAHELDADVIIQTYTMVPHAGIHDVIPKLLAIYQSIHNIARRNKQEYIIGGDSAGGNLAAVVLLAANDNKLELPDQALMLAPAMGIDLDTPENRAIEPNDSMLKVDPLLRISRGWATGPIDKTTIYKKPEPATEDEKIKLKHPYASPVHGDWSFLKGANMPITLIQGTHDILLPQVRQFVEKAKELDLELTYIEASRGWHDYPLAATAAGASWLAPDAIEGLRLMVESVLKYSKY